MREREKERERERDRKKDVWLLIKEMQISFKKRQALRENGEIFFSVWCFRLLC